MRTKTLAKNGGSNMVTIDQVALGVKLRELRTARGLSAYRLGELLDCGQTAYSRWERGLCVPTASYLYALSLAFGVSMEELLTGCVIVTGESCTEGKDGAA